MADEQTPLPLTTEGLNLRDKVDLTERLRKIEGQVRGLQRMVDEDRYCVDILVQLAAVRAALNRVAFLLLESHTRGCVAAALRRGDGDAAVQELLTVMDKLLKEADSRAMAEARRQLAAFLAALLLTLPLAAHLVLRLGYGIYLYYLSQRPVGLALAAATLLGPGRRLWPRAGQEPGRRRSRWPGALAFLVAAAALTLGAWLAYAPAPAAPLAATLWRLDPNAAFAASAFTVTGALLGNWLAVVRRQPPSAM